MTQRAVYVLLFLLCALCMRCHSQVVIELPADHFKAYDQIDVRIKNHTKNAITVCVEFGQLSFSSDGQSHGTPTPVYVERRTGTKWQVLLNGPYVGSSRQPVSLEAGKSSLFPFRLSDAGEMRLILKYSIGKDDQVCDVSKQRKTVRSRVFRIIKPSPTAPTPSATSQNHLSDPAA